MKKIENTSADRKLQIRYARLAGFTYLFWLFGCYLPPVAVLDPARFTMAGGLVVLAALMRVTFDVVTFM